MNAITKLGLSSVSINEETLEADRGLWTKVERGDFRLVFGTPESLLGPSSYLWKMLRKDRICPFLANLVLVAVDECHCVKDWHLLRPHYQLIGSLRTLLSGVTFMALSATLTTSSLSHLIKTANLRDPIHIQQSIARRNITFSGHEISSPGFDQLNFMIPDSAILAHQIPLGMVFIDNINEGMALVTHFRNRLPIRLRPRGSELVRLFNGEFDPVTRKAYLADFRNGGTRILVGTDAMGMGVDIKRILTVAQWEMSPILNASVLYQRLGRAGRDRTMSAYGKLFVQSKYLVENMSDAWLEANGIDDETLESILPTSARGRNQRRVPPVSAAKSYKRFKELLTTPVDRIHANIVYGFQLAIRKHREQMIKRLGAEVVDRHKIDLFLLWVINTTGCRHRVFHLIFNEPDLFKDMGNPLCCDCCHVERDGPGGIDLLGIPIHETVGCQVNQPWLDKWAPAAHLLPSGTSKPPMVRPAVNQARLERLVTDIRQWRDSLEQSSGNIHGISASQFIPDNDILKLRAKIRYIETETDLQEILRQLGYRFPNAYISDHVPDLLRCIQTSLSNTLQLQHTARLPSPPRSPIPEVPLPPPTLPWLKTTAQVDAGMRIAQNRVERDRQVALRKGQEEKARERNKVKELLKIKENEQRKRDTHRDREREKAALTSLYKRAKKAEERKEKEIERQALTDITNLTQRKSGRKRQVSERWEG